LLLFGVIEFFHDGEIKLANVYRERERVSYYLAVGK
jgi:hypothetical protein